MLYSQLSNTRTGIHDSEPLEQLAVRIKDTPEVEARECCDVEQEIFWHACWWLVVYLLKYMRIIINIYYVQYIML